MIKYEKPIDIIKKIKKNKTDNYYNFVIKENWRRIVGDVLAEYSFPDFFYNKKLTITVTDSLINHQFLTLKENVIQLINEFLNEEVINDIEIKTKSRYNKKAYEKEDKNVIIEDRRNLILEDIIEDIDIKISEKEREKINEIFDTVKIENKEITDRIKKIALEKIIDEKKLLLKGYIKCDVCGEVFLPKSLEKICIKCINFENEKEIEYITKEIKKLPTISYEILNDKKEIKENNFFRVRDLISQDIFYKMVDMVRLIKKQKQSYEALLLKRKTYEEEMTKYIAYNTGSLDKSVHEIMREKTNKKIERLVNFELQKETKYRR